MGQKGPRALSRGRCGKRWGAQRPSTEQMPTQLSLCADLLCSLPPGLPDGSGPRSSAERNPRAQVFFASLCLWLLVGLCAWRTPGSPTAIGLSVFDKTPRSAPHPGWEASLVPSSPEGISKVTGGFRVVLPDVGPARSGLSWFTRGEKAPCPLATPPATRPIPSHRTQDTDPGVHRELWKLQP